MGHGYVYFQSDIFKHSTSQIEISRSKAVSSLKNSNAGRKEKDFEWSYLKNKQSRKII
jgi:hypothetical protein